MSEAKSEAKSVEVLSVISKITEHKLCSNNYMDWRQTIELYLLSISMDHHISDDPPSDETKKKEWMREDARLFLSIRNSIDSTVIGLITHCKTVKSLMTYLEFLYSGKENVSRMFDVCQAFYRPEKGERSLTEYFMAFKKTYAELNELLPFDADISVQQTQREKMAVMSFLAGLSSDFEIAKSQVLSDSKISSLDEAFSRILRTEQLSVASSEPQSSALFSRAPTYMSGKPQYKNGGSKSSSGSGQWHDNAECRYCHEVGHIKRNCPKLRNKKPPSSAHVADSNGPLTVSASEYAKFLQYQEQHSSSSSGPATALANSGKPTACVASSPTKWVIDSGATDHMTGNPSLFSTFEPHSTMNPVTLADGSQSIVRGSGTVQPTSSLSLSSVLSLPELSYNLLSISKLTRDLNCSASFFPDYCLFQDLVTKQIIGKGHESDGLYILDTQPSSSVACLVTPMDAHRRLGHPSLSLLKKLCPQFSGLSSLDCESCQFAKLHRVSLSPRVTKRASAPFELVHSDVWGPCPITSKSGFRYFVTFVDDHSRLTWLYLMKNRSELFTHFSAFCAEIKTQFHVAVQILRSDNAKEYFSNTFQSFMVANGMLHQSSCVYTPAQNGVAERKNRHLLETARALLFAMKVPKLFWADAVSTACFLINRMPSSVLSGVPPVHVLFPSKSLYPIQPRVFGSTCFVRDVRPQVTKLDPKSLKCIFLGYSRVQKGYRCFCPSLNKYLVSTDVTFFEQTPFSSDSTPIPETEDLDFLVYTVASSPKSVPSELDESTTLSELPRPPIIHQYTRRPSVLPTEPLVSSSPDSGPDDPIAPSSDPVPSDDLPIALRKGKRSCTYPISSLVTYDCLSPSSKAFVSTLESVPKTVSQALAHPGWRNAMLEEMNALDTNGTWDLVDLPPGIRPIGCKWVFSVKVNPDGSVARLKARLVAKGYAQTYGVDYFETFSPVARLTSIRLVISLAASHRWPLYQLDVKNAFLHGDLSDTIYMEQPPGFVAQGESHKVCHLRKSLYGLKQSPREWFSTFARAADAFGLKQSISDDSVFYKNSVSGLIMLVVYVDDIVITGSDFAGIKSLRDFLPTQFNIKDLGELKYFLGIEVLRSKRGILLSQRKYVLDLLSETGNLGAKPCSTPMVPNLQLSKDGVPFDDPERYRRLVGKLNYLRVTRPDIAFPVSVVSQYMSSPTVDHWMAVKQILCYLKAAPGRGILYGDHGHDRIEGFSDASYAGQKEGRRSTSGYCVFFGGNLISWKSKKQNVVSLSTAESEYRAMAKTSCEILSVYNFLSEVGLKVSMPAKLWCDNQAALHIASNSVFHERTKHIEIDCHFIREKIKSGLIATGYMKTEDQLGDLFTKALNGVRINYLCSKLGIINIYAPA